MQFNIESFISTFVAEQFPEFYHDDGPTFILFVQAYYEWMEERGQAIGEARALFDTRDIDNTPEAFLAHFQKKYLYGIPFNVIINKRLLLKHVLDVYRSKGDILCFNLLFRLIYDEDVEVYLPTNDILRVSDGVWKEPRYVEVAESTLNSSYIGKTIIGSASGVTAVVESFIREPINKNIINIFYLSNITPRNGQFIIGEKIGPADIVNSAQVEDAPEVVGSLDTLSILSGGQDFSLGDILRVVYRDPDTGDVISYGRDGLVRVTGLQRSTGKAIFDIQRGGWGYTANAMVFIYNGALDTTGTGADFDVGSISYVKTLDYNTDIIGDYADMAMDAVAYGFPGNPSSNALSPASDFLSFSTDTFGQIASLTNVKNGNNYTAIGQTFIRSTLTSNVQPGTVSYSTSCNEIVGTATDWQSNNRLQANSIIALQSDPANSATIEYCVVNSIASDTSLFVHGKPTRNALAGAKYRMAPTIMYAQFAPYLADVYQVDLSIPGENEYISMAINAGNDTVASVTAINSGKGYVEGEIVKCYRTGALNALTVVLGGQDYSNGDQIVFVGGGIGAATANGYVTTNPSGNVTGATLTYEGAGYTEIPSMYVRSTNGVGCSLTTTIKEYNTFSEVTGRAEKIGIGRSIGYWANTNGFLNSNKYIQDSYFYQDYSYQLKTAMTLEKYQDILYSTFHIAGTELFGAFTKVDIVDNPTAYGDTFWSLEEKRTEFNDQWIAAIL